MLMEFSVKNFLSFKDRTTFSMLASSDKNLTNNFVTVNDKNILKISAIYGANASGKSNLFKAMSAMSRLIIESNYNSPEKLLPIMPFKIDKEKVKEPSEFEIKFIVDGVRYTYGFSADSKNVYNEELYYYPNNRITMIFKRSNIDNYTFNEKFKKELNDIKEKNTANKFFLSTATNWNFAETKIPYEFIANKIGVVLSTEQLNGYSFNQYSENKKIKKFALDFLKQADLNIDDYDVTEKEFDQNTLKLFPNEIQSLLSNNNTNRKWFEVSTYHNIGGEKYRFDISEESLGTQAMFSYIPVIKDVLDNNKIFIIDELDKSLHPLIVKFLVEIFNDPEINKNGSQLIFNTHDTNLLNLDILRRDQFWFLEKNPEYGDSELYPLDDFPVRNNENIEKGYMLGRYGAVPFITKDFL